MHSLTTRAVQTEKGPMQARSTPYPLVFVASYSTFSNLAHTPKGSPSPYTLYVYRLDPVNNSLTLLHTSNFDQNLAFLRYSRKHNVLYAVSESILETDKGTKPHPLVLIVSICFVSSSSHWRSCAFESTTNSR